MDAAIGSDRAVSVGNWIGIAVSLAQAAVMSALAWRVISGRRLREDATETEREARGDRALLVEPGTGDVDRDPAPAWGSRDAR